MSKKCREIISNKMGAVYAALFMQLRYLYVTAVSVDVEAFGRIEGNINRTEHGFIGTGDCIGK